MKRKLKYCKIICWIERPWEAKYRQKAEQSRAMKVKMKSVEIKIANGILMRVKAVAYRLCGLFLMLSLSWSFHFYLLLVHANILLGSNCDGFHIWAIVNDLPSTTTTLLYLVTYAKTFNIKTLLLTLVFSIHDWISAEYVNRREFTTQTLILIK